MKISKQDFKLRCNRNFWALSADEKTGDANLYIYSNVESDGFDWWSGETIKSETSAQYFREELEKLGDVKQINVYINSKGGDVGEGIGIYSQLKRHKAHKTAYIDGYACSIASVIPMACDEVVISPPATMMIHPAWSFAMGNAAELRKCADDLDKITESTKQAYLHKSGGRISAAKLTELMEAETWLTAQECIKYGLADRLLGEEDKKENPEEIPEEDETGSDDEGDANPEPKKTKTDEDDEFTEKAMSIFGNFFM